MNQHEIILYQIENTNICVNVVFENETFWMTQRAMAELFNVNVPAISKHLANIYEEELIKKSTVSKMEIVQKEGQRNVKRIQEFYNLDAIIATKERYRYCKKLFKRKGTVPFEQIGNNLY